MRGPCPGQIRVSSGREGRFARALSAGQAPRLVARSNGTGENGIAYDGDVRGILGPVSNNIGHTFFGVAGRLAVGDAKAAKMDEVIGAIAVLRGGVPGIGVKEEARIFLPNGSETGDVIIVHVGQKEMAQG